MKTEELIKLIKFRLTHDEDVRAKAEIIKRLKEYKELKRIKPSGFFTKEEMK